jgi:hypothetical protein
MKHAPLRYWLVILLSQLVGAAVILGVCVWFWHASWIAAAVFIAFMVLPVLFHAVLGSFGLDPTKTRDAFVTSTSDAPPLGQRIRIAALPVFIAGSLGTALLLSFLIPGVRIAILEKTSAERWQIPAENALWDVDPEVRLAACAAIREHSADVSGPALLDALGNDENLASCIMPTLTVGGEHIVLSWRQGQWFEALMHDKKSGEHMCELAGHLFHADRLGAPTAIPQLFSCAAAASTPEAQECCTQALSSIRKTGQADITELLATPETFATSTYAYYTPHFLKLLDTTHSSAPTRLTGPNYRQWVVKLACHTLQVAPRDLWTTFEPMFSEATSSQTCHAPELTDDTLRLWQATCARWTDPQDPPSFLCEQMTQVANLDANNRARRSIQTAIYRASYTDEPVFSQTKKQAYEQKLARHKGQSSVDIQLAPTNGMEQLLQVWGQELPSSDNASRMQQIEQLREIIRSRQFDPTVDR